MNSRKINVINHDNINEYNNQVNQNIRIFIRKKRSRRDGNIGIFVNDNN